MSRRASLPGASELFRLTSSPALDVSAPAAKPAPAEPKPKADAAEERALARSAKARRGSPRQKHDAKITVYVAGEELLAMEHARLILRGSHGLVVDRGRLVREAVAVLLADFEEFGEDSVLVRRLRDAEAEEPGESEAEDG